MASTVILSQTATLSSSSSTTTTAKFSSLTHSPIFHTNALRFKSNKKPLSLSLTRKALRVSASSQSLQALIFDCDGVIIESEHLHRQAYNDAFSHFNVRCDPSSQQSLNWDPEFYDVLQNQIGGGKPKMRWYFKEHGWPSSTILDNPPVTDDDQAKLIDLIQDWKTERYQQIIKSGTVEPRPGVLRLMDEAKAAGKKVAVCSAATKSSVILCLENLIGMVYRRRTVGGRDRCHRLQAATRAGMACSEHFTSSSTAERSEDNRSLFNLNNRHRRYCLLKITRFMIYLIQDFKDAIAIYPDLSNVRLKDLELLLQNLQQLNLPNN
ncbi:hypothetical protein CUMW_038730 [Citrus unshiu]|nr:hypothetical protein CUMW_038730 [Citrus unshiu]